MTWTAEDLLPGSPQRCQVAALLEESGLVDDQMLRLFPSRRQREIMGEYTRPRMFEKITGLPVVSNPNQWNRDNMWNPLLKRSFCAWAKNLAYTIARTNASRQLHSGPIPASMLEEEDGFNPAFDDQLAQPLMMHAHAGVFDEHPRLVVPRPVGKARESLLKIYRQGIQIGDEHVYQHVVDAMRLNWWHHSLDDLPTSQIVDLMLHPLSTRLFPLVYASLPDDWHETTAAYLPSQTVSMRGFNSRRWLTCVDQLVTNGLAHDDWEVTERLGTVCARITCG